MPSYRICGLVVSADRELAGLTPLTAGDVPADLTLRRTDIPDSLPAARHRRPMWEASDRQFLWSGPGLGRILATDGCLLEVQPAPGASDEDLLPFVMGTGIGAILYQRSTLVLHAAAVAIDGRAHVFCGVSGVGKSTLAAALCQSGARFISDDVTAVTLDDLGRPIVHPDGRSLRLLPSSIRRLQLDQSSGARVRAGVDKFLIAPFSVANDAPVPVASIYVLTAVRRLASIQATDLPWLESAQVILGNFYRRPLALALMRDGQTAAVTGAMLRHARVSIVERPETGDTLDALVSLVHDRGRSAGR